MNIFLDAHRELLARLTEKKVEFILIGGYSVIFHGYKRTTGDMDLWLKPDNENKKKLLPVLQSFGFNSDELTAVESIDFTKHAVFSIWDDPEKVDFITIINLVSFDEADQQKIVADVDGLTVPVIHINHLILSKINTGRLQDKADIEKLQELQNKSLK